MKKYLLLLLLLIPTFFRMLRPGIYTMQDFPYFRLIEYSRCLQDIQIPCRWAANAGLGFGEPVFNYYSHVPFITGASLVTLGFGAMNSLKILFITSLIFSGFGMFMLSRRVWKNDYSAYISSILYVYAPYRALNIWVRGALPESFAFIFLPFILLSFEKYRDTKSFRWLASFSILLSLLILTHNLSVLLFAPAIVGFILFQLISSRSLRLLFPLTIAAIASLFLSSFYLLPTIVEAPLVNLQTTTQGYFDFRAHFVTVPQLFFSRFWGYGGSTWGDQDGLSLAVGQIQWIVALFVGIAALIKCTKKKATQSAVLVLFLLLITTFFLFLTHNKSAFVWEAFSDVLKYIQFPWRFLGVIVFLMSLAAGYSTYAFPKQGKLFSILVITLSMTLNFGFYKEDIWRSVTDKEMQTGDLWVEQTRASIGDYWPKYGPIPTSYASLNTGITEVIHSSKSAEYAVASKTTAHVSLPIAYFPGWSGEVNGNIVSLQADSQGQIEVPVQKGQNVVKLHLESTNIQTIGNILSLITVLVLISSYWYLELRNKK